MKTKQFLAGAAKTVFALAAVVMMSSVFTACSKDNNDDNDGTPVITATTSKAVGETIEIQFAKTDVLPEVEGLEQVKKDEGKVTYKILSQTFRVKGEITLFCVNSGGLTKVEFTPGSRLTYIDLDGNQLSSLDVSMLSELDGFRCGRNNLKALRLAHNPKLRLLGCQENQITRLDLSKNTAMDLIICYKNQLTGTSLKLPRVKSGEIDFKDESDGDTQFLTKDEVAAYKALNWKAKKYTPSGWRDYEGE